MKSFTLLLSVIFVHSVLGWNNPPATPPPAEAPGCNCNESLKFATFNVFQSAYAPFKQERFAALVDYLNGPSTNFDVLCLQEVHESAQRDELISTLSGRYPNSFFSDVSSPNTCIPSCSTTDMDIVFQCAILHGCNYRTDYEHCIQQNCVNLLNNNVCSQCIFNATLISNQTSSNSNTAGAGTANDQTPFVHLWEKCGGLITVQQQNNQNKNNKRDDDDHTTQSATNNDCQLLSSCNYLHNATNGLLLLSRYEIVNTKVQFLFPHPMDAWAVIVAQINVPSIGLVDAYCTQLVKNFTANQTFVRERQQQTRELITFINRTSRNMENAVSDKKRWSSAPAAPAPPVNSELIVVMGDFQSNIQFYSEQTTSSNTHSKGHDDDDDDDNTQQTTQTCKTLETRPPYRQMIDSGFTDGLLVFSVDQHTNLTGVVDTNQIISTVGCTYCSNNKLVRLQKGVNATDQLVDFIFISSNARFCANNAKIFGRGDRVSVEVPNYVNDQIVGTPSNPQVDNNPGVGAPSNFTNLIPIQIPLSDHNGVSVWLCPSTTTIGGIVETLPGQTFVGSTSTTGQKTSGAYILSASFVIAAILSILLI